MANRNFVNRIRLEDELPVQPPRLAYVTAAIAEPIQFPVARRYSQRLIDLSSFPEPRNLPQVLTLRPSSAFSAVAPRNHSCQFCNRTFRFASMLAQHLPTHTGSKQFQCTDCGKAFTRAYTLKIHSRLHRGQTPYKCPMCPKQYVEAGKLNMHMKRVHEGLRPCVCDVCGKRFPCPSQWSVHQRVHTGEKPFACEQCGKTFSVNSSLQRHQLTHS